MLLITGLSMLASCGTSTRTVIKTTTTVAPTPSTTSTTSAVTTTTTTAPPTTATAPVVYFQGVAGPGRQRPTSLELTGDGTLFVSGVQWTSWGGAQATGSGIAHYHGCTPNCAQAPAHDALVAVRMFGIRTCGGRAYYSGVTLTLNSGRLLDKAFLQRSWSPC